MTRKPPRTQCTVWSRDWVCWVAWGIKWSKATPSISPATKLTAACRREWVGRIASNSHPPVNEANNTRVQ